MARDSSKKGGKRPQGGGGRVRANRPPIIDMEPAEDAGAQANPSLDFSTIKWRLSQWLERCVAWMVSASKFCLERPAMAVAIAIGAILVVALVATQIAKSPPKEPIKVANPPADQRIERLERELARLNREIAALGPRLRAGMARDLGAGDARAAQQARGLKALQAGQDKINQRVVAAERSGGALAGKFDAKLQPLADTLKTLVARLKAFDAQTQNLAKALGALSARIGALENAQGRIKRTAADLKANRLNAENILALQRAGRGLIVALALPDPYVKALTAYARIFPDDVAVRLLQPHAATGVLTLDQLKARARKFAGGPDQTGKPPPPPEARGFFDRLSQWSKSLVRIRRKSDHLTGERRVWENALAKLEAGDLAGALGYVLSRPVQGEKKNWVDQAQARLLVNRQISSLKVRLETISAVAPAAKVN